jgi:hypothetical protein
MIEMTRKQPTGNDGYEITRFNALRHGVLSRYTVLPWEDQAEYCSLLDALVAEHKPEGPTEEHLVEEITGILWRKRRLRLAEGAACRRGLSNATSPAQQIVKAALVHLSVGKQMALDTAKELADLDEDRAITTRALDLLEAGKGRAYDKALGSLREVTQQWWAERIKPKRPFDLLDLGDVANRYSADADGLLQFLAREVMPRYETRRQELLNRPLIQEQAFGEAIDPDRLEGLARYEAHLDRKLERMLTMLIRLKDLKGTPDPK